MRKRLFHGLLALAMLMAPLCALAGPVSIPRFGAQVVFPPTLDVLYRDMPEDDPVLALYGKSAEQVTRELKNQGLYALAYDIAGEYSISLSLTDEGGPGFDAMDEAALQEAARQYGGGQYERFSGRQGSFLLVYDANGRGLGCLLRAGSLLFELRLQARAGLSPDMVSVVKGIAARADLGLGQ